jgi:hypothetical protein
MRRGGRAPMQDTAGIAAFEERMKPFGPRIDKNTLVNGHGAAPTSDLNGCWDCRANRDVSVLIVRFGVRRPKRLPGF